MNNLSHAVRRFNRFELKYLITLRQAERFKHDLGAYLLPDDHGDAAGSYTVESLYYDSPDYRCYWEKVDGIRFRRKLRIRRYISGGSTLTPEMPVFVEIKQRLNRVTQKRRLSLPFAQAVSLCTARQFPAAELDGHGQSVADEVIAFGWQYDLWPASVVNYTRQALVGSDYDIGLRVTLDRDLRYRAHSLFLNGSEPADGGAWMFPPDWVVLEIKANERVPYWLTELVAQHNLNLMRVSKYCRSIEMAQKVEVPSWRLSLA